MSWLSILPVVREVVQLEGRSLPPIVLMRFVPLSNIEGGWAVVHVLLLDVMRAGFVGLLDWDAGPEVANFDVVLNAFLIQSSMFVVITSTPRC